MTVSGSDAPRLIVDDLSGTRVVLAPGEDLTVGRMGRVVVGEDDAHMHRVLLVFWSADGVWWMGNEGTRLTVSVETRGERSISQSRLGPGASLPLPPGESAVVFATATSAYEIRVAVTGRGVHPPEPVVVGGRPTVGTFSPNLDQVALLTALVEPLLRLPAADVTEVPSVAQLEDRLGWTKKKVNTRIVFSGPHVVDRPSPSDQKFSRANRARARRRVGALPSGVENPGTPLASRVRQR